MAPKQDVLDIETKSNFRNAQVNITGTIADSIHQEKIQNSLFLKTAQETVSELSGIPVLDRSKVLQIARRIYPHVENWLKDYPVLSTKRLPAICLTAAAICPDSSDEVISQIAIFSMILIGIDDLTDNGTQYQLTKNQTRQLLKVWENTVKEASAESKSATFNSAFAAAFLPAETQVTKALAAFCTILKNSPYAEDYYTFFIRRLSLLMQSMETELDWQEKLKAHGEYPNYHDYLVNGRESIEAPTLMTALLILTGPAWQKVNLAAPTMQNRLLGQLEDLLFSCGSSIRLTNDIGGFERELQEQKPNSVSILLNQQKKFWTGKPDEKIEQMFLKNVKEAVLREADNNQLQLEKQVARLPESLAEWGKSVLRVTNFCRDFSLAREFYTLSLEMLDKLKTGLN